MVFIVKTWDNACLVPQVVDINCWMMTVQGADQGRHMSGAGDNGDKVLG